MTQVKLYTRGMSYNYEKKVFYYLVYCFCNLTMAYDDAFP